MEALFATYDLHAVLENHARKAVDAVRKVNDDYLLQASDDRLIEELIVELRVDPLVLDTANITTDQREVDVSVAGDLAFARGRSVSFRGTAFSFFVPYRGDRALFDVRPSQYTLRYPRVTVSETELHFRYERTDHDVQALKAAFEDELCLTENFIGFQRNDIDPFNQRLPDLLRKEIAERRAKLLADRGTVAGLGYRLRERPEAVRTTATRAVKRQVRPRAARRATTAPFEPEPTLPPEDYEHILDVLRNMVHVIERSPAAFATLDEEALRTHFLVQLNGHYDGQATGETFNFTGKTDVLIRDADKNIFVAECKFWNGPKAFSRTIDQLLGYTSWRDTKTAIILFNRNRTLSTVLTKIPEAVRAHPNFVRDGSGSTSETEFRFVLRHRDDPLRELQLAVMVFEVPEAPNLDLSL